MTEQTPNQDIGTHPVRLQINQQMASMELMKATAFPFTFPVKLRSLADADMLSNELRRLSDIVVDNRLIGEVTFGPDGNGVGDSGEYVVKVRVSLLDVNARMHNDQMERVIRKLYARVLQLEDDLFTVRSQTLPQ